jgi:hypothetical protein
MTAYNKAIAAALGALGQLAVALNADGVSAQEWVQVAIAALTVLAVGAVANKTAP